MIQVIISDNYVIQVIGIASGELESARFVARVRTVTHQGTGLLMLNGAGRTTPHPIADLEAGHAVKIGVITQFRQNLYAGHGISIPITGLAKQPQPGKSKGVQLFHV